MVFSERLTELLGASRGGATRLSEAMGVSKSTVSDWKNGRKEPSMENCERKKALPRIVQERAGTIRLF